MQNRALQIIMGVDNRESCSQIFMDCRSLTVISLYILEVLYYIKQHNGNLTQNLNIYDGNTREKNVIMFKSVIHYFLRKV